MSYLRELSIRINFVYMFLQLFFGLFYVVCVFHLSTTSPLRPYVAARLLPVLGGGATLVTTISTHAAELFAALAAAAAEHLAAAAEPLATVAVAAAAISVAAAVHASAVDVRQCHAGRPGMANDQLQLHWQHVQLFPGPRDGQLVGGRR